MRGYIDTVVEVALAAFMAAMCVIVFLGVVFRYVLLDPITWAEEVGRVCLIWTTFLGTYLAYRRNVHISIDLVRRFVPLAGRRAIHLFCLILMAAFMGLLAIEGGRYSQAFLGSRTPVLGMSIGMIYTALPLGAALFFVTLVIDLLRFLTGGMRLADEQGKGDAI